jgi:hypothetical protein
VLYLFFIIKLFTFKMPCTLSAPPQARGLLCFICLLLFKLLTFKMPCTLSAPPQARGLLWRQFKKSNVVYDALKKPFAKIDAGVFNLTEVWRVLFFLDAV